MFEISFFRISNKSCLPSKKQDKRRFKYTFTLLCSTRKKHLHKFVHFINELKCLIYSFTFSCEALYSTKYKSTLRFKQQQTIKVRLQFPFFNPPASSLGWVLFTVWLQKSPFCCESNWQKIRLDFNAFHYCGLRYFRFKHFQSLLWSFVIESSRNMKAEILKFCANNFPDFFFCNVSQFFLIKSTIFSRMFTLSLMILSVNIYPAKRQNPNWNPLYLYVTQSHNPHDQYHMLAFSSSENDTIDKFLFALWWKYREIPTLFLLQTF